MYYPNNYQFSIFNYQLKSVYIEKNPIFASRILNQ